MAVRLFFAIPLAEPAKELLLTTQQVLVARARPSWGLRAAAAQQLHLTLKFVGHVAEEQVPEFAAVVAEQAALTPEIGATLAGVTAFPSPRRAGVIAVLFEEPTGTLADLAARVEDATERLGVARERRAFRAHATLARLRHPSDVRTLLADATAARRDLHDELRFTELRLYRSTLSPRGSMYETLARSGFTRQAAAARTGRPINE